MNSQIIVEKYGATLKCRQQMLWDDYDLILTQTEYKNTGDFDFDRQAVAHWWMNIYTPQMFDFSPIQTDDDKMNIYRSWDNAIHDNFDYCGCDGCFWPDINQSSVRISAMKKEPLEDHVKDFMVWFPLVKEDKEGVKKFQIFEKSLSRNESYYLHIKGDNAKIISNSGYCDTKHLAEFNVIEEAIDYIRKNLYWQKKK